MKGKGRPKGANKALLEKIEALIVQYLTANPAGQPTHFLVEEFKISRQAALAHLNRMIRKGVLVPRGHGRWRKYEVAKRKAGDAEHSLSMPITQLAKAGEDEVFRHDIAPWLHKFAANNAGLLARQHYALTEILNNVIDHSQGTTVIVRGEKSCRAQRYSPVSSWTLKMWKPLARDSLMRSFACFRPSILTSKSR